MVKVDIDEVERLAQISALELKPDEAKSLTSDLENILSSISQLSELDTTGVEPTYQVGSSQTVYREDVVDSGPVSAQALLNLAPDSQEMQVKVPKVL